MPPYCAVVPYKLTGDAEDSSSAGVFRVPRGRYVVLDLNGHKVDGNECNRSVIAVGGSLTITKADSSVASAPKAKTGLVESGSAQALVEKGTADGGTMLYSLDGTTFSAEIPTAAKAGEYTVYYKVEGDKNHNGTEAQTVKVTIAEKKAEPTAKPSTEPTAKPTATPTATPTAAPTATPTAKPTRTPKPTAKPTVKPAVADYTLLARLTVSGSGKDALKLTWTKVAEADGYDIYFAKCGKDFKLKKTVNGSDTCKVRFTGLKKRECYKAYVRAWMKVNGVKVYIGKSSPQVHAITGGYDKDYCNTQSVKLDRTALSLKVGRSKTLTAKLKGVKSGKKTVDHMRKVRWYSSNVNVATVDKNGRVKVIGKGSCTVYAIANNGVRTSVKVTVK